ncbi:MAG: hypothetical protein QM808_10910 [Steroidobacteraceae bacterium]
MKKISVSLATVLYAVVLGAGLVACKEKGPVEQFGEEVDEAVDTAKNGGKESTANKVDDAVDDLREGAKDAAKEVKGK